MLKINEIFHSIQGESSYNGILACPKNSKKVLIHDAARPFVSQEIITSCIEALNNYFEITKLLGIQKILMKLEAASRGALGVEAEVSFAPKLRN